MRAFQIRRLGLGFCVLFGGWGATLRAQQAPGEALGARVDAALAITGFDDKLFRDLAKLPVADRVPLLGKFSEAASGRMRQRALEELVAARPDPASETVRGFASDRLPEVDTLALAYLFLKLGDAGAEKGFLASLNSPERSTAVAAGRALALFPEEERAIALLNQMLLAKDSPLAMRCETLLALASSRNRAALPTVFRLLDDQTPLRRTPDDTARLCDYAAQTVARIYGAYRVPMDAYYRADIAVRDRAIAKWQAWGAIQTDLVTADPREEVMAATAKEALAAFAAPDGDRKAARDRLRLAFRANLCLGILPGIDEVVLPSAREFVRLLSILKEGQRVSETQYWDRLDLRLRRELLQQTPELSKAPADEQALAFLRFLVESPSRIGDPFPSDWAWSFCRSFPEVFPGSAQRSAAKEYGEQIQTRIREKQQMIVMHGSLPELEPIPKPAAAPKPGGMIQIGLGATMQRMENEPSEWRHYREAVACVRKSVAKRRARGKEVRAYGVFERNMIPRYPANEIPLLGEAALHLRVWDDPATALEYARRARALNPGNAKVHAVLGMICLRFDPPRRDEAFAALQEAGRRQPEAIGGEPESAEATAFLLEEVAKRDGQEAASTLRGVLRVNDEQH